MKEMGRKYLVDLFWFIDVFLWIGAWGGIDTATELGERAPAGSIVLVIITSAFGLSYLIKRCSTLKYDKELWDEMYKEEERW